MTHEEFRNMVDGYLQTLDDGSDSEWYCTEREHARGVLTELEDHLFREERERLQRLAEYLRLKAEFEPEQ